MFQSLAATSGGASGGGPGGGASEGLVASLVRECLLALPPAFDLEAVQHKYPVVYEESMNTVLVQEMTRFNKLTGVIRDSLQSIDLALKVHALCVLGFEQDHGVRSCLWGTSSKLPRCMLLITSCTRQPMCSLVVILI